MPLLSTLAAVIIIVHSLEEADHYDHHFSPRLLETGASDYHRWRTVELEPMMQESAPIEDEHEIAPQEPLKRRRPGRKRKRRPHAEDTIHEHRMKDEQEFEDTFQSYYESESQVVYETTELPRRRRKRPEMRNNPSEDEVQEGQEVQRPTRRRGQRRRRPQNRENEDGLTVNEPHRPLQSGEEKTEERWNDHNNEGRYRMRPTEPKTHKIHLENYERPVRKQRISPEDRLFDDTQEEKSTSESEEMQPRVLLDITMTSTSTTESSSREKSMIMDALSLKELLKRSDGASLSEILQRRNLTLADLLNGRENALSALQTEYPFHQKQKNAIDVKENNNYSEEQIIPEFERQVKNTVTPLEELIVTPTSEEILPKKEVPNLAEVKEEEHKLIEQEEKQVNNKVNTDENRPRMSNRRRLPPGSRRRLRIKPQPNNDVTPTIDLVPQSPRRTVKKMLTNPTIHDNIFTTEVNNYSNNERLATTLSSTTISDTTEHADVITASSSPAEITTTTEHLEDDVQHITYSTKATTKSATITVSRAEPSIETSLEVLLTEKSESPVPHKRHKIQAPDLELRRQVLTNRLKKKRLKQKDHEQDSPDESVKELFGMANVVSASEFIAQVQDPDIFLASTASDNNEQFVSALQDVTMPDDMVTRPVNPTKPSFLTEKPTTKIFTPTETAKIEIEEILNDSNTGARLSKILSERNMTVNELVEHRERGSSQVHLADIFHNTSKEPNPPEPFLSKSLIEPISKETYPLRALLEANLHDPSVKLQTPDRNSLQFGSMPIAMEFGNNVNENGENLGIISLFNKFNNTIDSPKTKVKTDSEGTPYFTSVSPDNTSNDIREGRGLQDLELLALKEIFTNMKKELLNKNKTSEEATTEDTQTTTSYAYENSNNDGLIVLEDVHINDISNNIASTSDEEIEVSDEENSTEQGMLENLPSNAKSVTIATAAIAGLTMLLFLLTYIGCKWKHQRNVTRKRETLSEERIPTPVFESRKLSKMNSSNRSISPMLSNSNIYTMSTLDSRNGKESPEYMWDSLRKPFQ